MPRLPSTKSAIRNPVDYILGTRAAVSVLRALSTAQVPLSQSELARRAELHLRGLPATLAALEAVGVISYAGRGRTRQVQLHHQHPFVQELRHLFQAETSRWNRIVQGLRQAAAEFRRGLVAAWIEGPVAEGTDTIDDSIDVTFLFDQPADNALQAAVRESVNRVQLQEHVIIALRFHQRADMLRTTPERRVNLRRALLLHGPAPVDLLPVTNEGDNDDLEFEGPPEVVQQARSMAEKVASRLTHDPEMVVLAREFVDRRLAIAGATERLVLLEWKGLLDSLTPGQLARLLREKSERADRLRQSLPFVGVLGDATSR